MLPQYSKKKKKKRLKKWPIVARFLLAQESKCAYVGNKPSHPDHFNFSREVNIKFHFIYEYLYLYLQLIIIEIL